MPFTYREYYIPCRKDECIKLVELIRENISLPEAVIEVEEHGIRIRLYGYKTDIKNSWNRIKRVLKIYRESILKTPLGYKYSIESIVASIRKTFPPQILAKVLEKKGYTAKYSEGYIETNASREEVEEIANRIADVIQEIRFDAPSTTTKYFIATASVVEDKDPREVIDEAIELGLLYRDEDDKVRLRLEWRQALDKYLRREPYGKNSSSIEEF